MNIIFRTIKYDFKYTGDAVIISNIKNYKPTKLRGIDILFIDEDITYNLNILIEGLKINKIIFLNCHFLYEIFLDTNIPMLFMSCTGEYLVNNRETFIYH